MQQKQIFHTCSWDFADAGRNETQYITHGYHRYPAKFIPHLARQLLETYTSIEDCVIDPFAGCGTTLVEAKLLGRDSIGFDVNPVAKLITDTKVTTISPKHLSQNFVTFQETYDVLPLVAPVILFDRLLYWFDENTLTDLNRVYQAIFSIPSFQIRRFFLCAFSHILKYCSLWSIKSVKPMRVDKNHEFVPIEIFAKHLRFMMEGNEVFFSLLRERDSLDVASRMHLRDATKRLPIATNSVDCIITSPPYVTSYEYADLHQLSLFWFANDRERFPQWYQYICEYRRFRQRFIGTIVGKDKAFHSSSGLADEIVRKLLLRDRFFALRVGQYFSDMYQALSEQYRILRRGGRLCIVVGDTVLKGVPIVTTDVISEQMEEIGFRHVERIRRNVRRKLVTPLRDGKTGRFVRFQTSNTIRSYQNETIIVMEKPS